MPRLSENYTYLIFTNIKALDSLPIKDITKKDYANKLKVVDKLLAGESGSINSLITKMISKLKTKYPNKNTRTNYLSAIIKYVQATNEKVDEDNLKKLKEENSRLIQEFQEQPKVEPKDVKTTKDTFEQKKDELLLNAKNQTLADYSNNLERFMNYNLAAFIVDFPRRNEDIMLLHFVKKIKDTSDMSKNYIVKTPKRTTIIFNQHKAVKAYGPQKFVITDEKLLPIIDNLVKYLKPGDKIFNKSKTTLIKVIKDITQIRFGKPLTTTDIRKLHSTTKFSKLLEEMENDSKLLGHSVATKIKFYTF